MKASEFDLRRDLRLDPHTGITTFRHNRVMIFDANVFGLVRQELIEEIGTARAKDFFLRLGFQLGYSDFLQMKMLYRFDTEMDLLAAGMVIHAWQGLVQATPREIRFDRETGDFLSTGVWNNSFEAQQHLCFNPPAKSPVCWTMMGYASGWCTAFFGNLLLAIEPVCVGQGADHCEWRVMIPARWGRTADGYSKVYRDLLYGADDGRQAA